MSKQVTKGTTFENQLKQIISQTESKTVDEHFV